MKRTEKNRLLRRIKLRPPQHWWKAKRVRASVATQENAPVYMKHLRTNTSRTPMRRREMMVAAVQLRVIYVLQSTLGKVTPLPLGNAQGRMRAKCGDAALRAHMETSPANALYTSPKIQNELITLCGKIIQRKIVENVNSGSCFSVLADEATDISGTAHISLCVRYVGHDTSGVPILKEDFVDFVPVYDLTGKALASTILNSLRGHGFDLNLLCGQRYDGAASMSGHLNGVQAFIRQTAPETLYVHCSAHSLNLALLHACKLPSIRNCLGTVSSTCTFVGASPQRAGLRTG
ncbi:hypothetical protein HPB51_022975 [Rhipicephalus microplus]|uniref:DUF4371 domain-containing protein n=1 Tax=Rhipicephalus microplus TaxID=6941 RepID=A0A9J6DD05_RHIMP|nr:hypothetical protein HPB51_022975 [Rhipicephalus microplus]